MQRTTVLIVMIVIRVATGNVVEMESEPDKKGEGGATLPATSIKSR